MVAATAVMMVIHVLKISAIKTERALTVRLNVMITIYARMISATMEFVGLIQFPFRAMTMIPVRLMPVLEELVRTFPLFATTITGALMTPVLAELVYILQ